MKLLTGGALGLSEPKRSRMAHTAYRLPIAAAAWSADFWLRATSIGFAGGPGPRLASRRSMIVHSDGLCTAIRALDDALENEAAWPSRRAHEHSAIRVYGSTIGAHALRPMTHPWPDGTRWATRA